ncbi:unnamed protein product [Rangifer tarandus platyrhynchus]|uniref:Uncharacterized protein n=1 Tax=Rangifer tarandus platyrhynchus TaxID=3082113 RepID=A0AC59ZH85_RANTA
MCRVHVQYPASAPASSEEAVGFLVVLCLVHDVPNYLCTPGCFQSLMVPSVSCCSVQGQALKQTVPGFRPQPVSTSFPYSSTANVLSVYPGPDLARASGDTDTLCTDSELAPRGHSPSVAAVLTAGEGRSVGLRELTMWGMTTEGERASPGKRD